MKDLGDRELVEKLETIESRVSDLEQVEYQTSHTVPREPDAIAEFHGLIQKLPALRGYWPLNSLQEPGSGNCWQSAATGSQDLKTYGTFSTVGGQYAMSSSQGRNAGFFANNGNAYLRRADGSQFDFSGTESNVLANDRGLTIGGVCQLRDISTMTLNEGMVGKWNAVGNQRSYLVYFTGGLTPKQMVWGVCGDGTTATDAYLTLSRTWTVNEWIFFLAEFDAYNSEMRFRVNGTTSTLTTGVPTSIFNSTQDFGINSYGDWATSKHYNGTYSNVFTCSAAINNRDRDYGSELYTLAKLIWPGMIN